MTDIKTTILLPLAIWLLVFVIHAKSPVINSTDSVWSVYAAKSLLMDGDMLLDEYSRQAKQRGNYGLRRKGKHFVNYFPPGTSLLAVPFVAGLEYAPDLFCALMPGYTVQACREIGGDYRSENLHSKVERTAASFYVALCALALFIYARKISSSAGIAAVTALSFGFCTSAWSVASRGLWQHGPVMLLLSLMILCLSSERWWLRGLAGFLAGISYIVRPTTGPALLIFALPLIRDRKALVAYFFSAACALLPFFYFSYSFYSHILPPYYRADRLRWHDHIVEAIFAHLFSPSRGLFIFSPFLLPCAVLAIMRAARKEINGVEAAALLFFMSNLLSVSFYPEWWGGHTYGPRYMTDVIPCLIIFLPRVLEGLSRPGRVVMALALGAAFLIHAHGALDRRIMSWNMRPENVDDRPRRVWQAWDAQFLH